MKAGVRLKPNRKEGWPEEFGSVLEDQEADSTKVYPLLIGVEVDEEFRSPHDDGNREVAYEDLELVASRSHT